MSARKPCLLHRPHFHERGNTPLQTIPPISMPWHFIPHSKFLATPLHAFNEKRATAILAMTKANTSTFECNVFLQLGKGQTKVKLTGKIGK